MADTYIITVQAASRLDAIDIARRRAREDGYRHEGEARVSGVVGSEDRWSVELKVRRVDR